MPPASLFQIANRNKADFFARQKAIFQATLLDKDVD
jgi:hypothetical protein